MKCFNTDWDRELIKRLKRGRSAGRGCTRSDRATGRGDRSNSPVAGNRIAGRWTTEQRLALKAAKEAEKRAVVQSAVNGSHMPVEPDKARLFDSPFWKIRMEIMESKSRNLGYDKTLDSQGFRKKMKILDDRANEMKKILTPPRKPHQELPPVKKMAAAHPTPKIIEVIAEKPKTPNAGNMEDVLQKRVTKNEPNFIDFSTMSTGVWSDICGVEHGESIPILMKSIRTQHWEKIIKYYGVFERAGRLDRGILYELASDLGEKLLEHPTYKEVVRKRVVSVGGERMIFSGSPDTKLVSFNIDNTNIHSYYFENLLLERNLDQDPNEGLFLLGKIMMNIYHNIALQAGHSGRSLTIQEISSKLDSGYKTIMKTKKEDDVRSNMRSNLKAKI